MGETAQELPAAAARAQVITDLYEQDAGTVRRMVASRARVPEAVLEDACQTAWERLWSHTEVILHRDVAMRWLVVTAMREAWREYRRELLVGPADLDVRSLPGATDPLDVVVGRERIGLRASRLTIRERQFLVMHGVGMSYREIGAQTGSTVRTVERLILRARRKLQAEARRDAA